MRPDDASPAAVARLLADPRRRPYARLVACEVVTNMSSWLNYIAVLRSLAAAAPPGREGLLVGLATALHYAPGVLFPLTGWAADAFPRELVLAASSGAAAVAVAAQAAVAAAAVAHGGVAVPLMLLLVLAQCTASSFYDPARAALTPRLVPRRQLRLASTIDACVWSSAQALGAAAGGLILSRAGAAVCFGVDAAGYVLAAGVALTLRGHADAPVGDDDGEAEDGGRDPETARLTAAATELSAAVGGGGGRVGGGGDSASSPAKARSPAKTEAAGARTPSPTRRPPPQPPAPPSSRTLAAAVAAAAADVAAGIRYCASNPHVAAVASIKASGCLVWGAAEVINVQLGDALATPARDAATVVGLIFGAVGLGCMAGSAVANATAAYTQPGLLRAVAAACASIAAGYAAMAVGAADSLLGACLASATRSAGSAVVWSYSTLLLQLAVPDAVLGRVSALEQAGYSVARSAAVAFGALFDRYQWNVAQSSTLLAGAGAALTAWWTVYARRARE